MKLFRIKIKDRTFAVRANNQMEAGFKLKKALRDSSLELNRLASNFGGKSVPGEVYITYRFPARRGADDFASELLRRGEKFSRNSNGDVILREKNKEYRDSNTLHDNIRELKKGEKVKFNGKEYIVEGFYKNGKIVNEDYSVREKPEVADFAGIRLRNLATGGYADINRFQIEDSGSKLRDVALNTTVQCYIFSGDKVLIQDRIGPAWKGLAVPGGHVKNRESLESACIRETLEETGLKVRDIKLFGTHQYTCEEDGESIALLYKTYSFEGELRGSEEGRVFWMPVREVLASDKCADGFKELLLKAVSDSELLEDSSVKDSPLVFKPNTSIPALKSNIISIIKKRDRDAEERKTEENSLGSNLHNIISDTEESEKYYRDGTYKNNPNVLSLVKNHLEKCKAILDNSDLKNIIRKDDGYVFNLYNGALSRIESALKSHFN